MNEELSVAYLGGLDLGVLWGFSLGSKDLGKEAFTLDLGLFDLGLFDLVLYVSMGSFIERGAKVEG